MIDFFSFKIIPIFNVLFGIIMLLTGLEKIKPFRKDKELEYRKYNFLFKLGGIGLIIWGIIKLF